MNPKIISIQNLQGQEVKTVLKSDQSFVTESDLKKQANCLHIAVKCKEGIICVLCGKKEDKNAIIRYNNNESKPFNG